MYEYDVFISYSRKDREFASRLQARLEKFRPPKGLDLPSRPLRVFRDEGDLTGTDYFRSIDKHLARSASLLVLCSPDARASKYVDDEIVRWTRSSPADRLIPVLVSGTPNNEAPREEAKAFPEALCKALAMPLATSYLGFDVARDRVDRGSFQNSWYTVLANVLQVSRSQVEERDRKRQQRRKNTIIGITSAVILALSSLTVYSLVQRNLADKRYQQALAKQLVIQSDTMLASTPDKVGVSVMLATEAVRRVPSIESTQALRAGLALFPQMHWKTHHPSPTGIDVHFTSDGSHIVTADGIWQTATGQRLTTLEHEQRSRALAMSTDGRLIARAGGSRQIDLWRTDTGKPVTHTPLRHPEPQSVLAFNPAGRLLVSAGEASTAVVWGVKCGCTVTKLAHGDPQLSGPIRAAAFSPDGKYLAVARRNEVRFWDTQRWQEVSRSLIHKTGAVRDLSFDPGGSFIVTVTHSAVHVWHPSGDEKNRFPLSREVAGSRLAVSPDGRYIALTGGRSQVWRWPQANAVLELDTGGAIAFSPDSTLFAVGGHDNTARVMELRTTREIARMPHGGAVTALRFSPNSLMLATVAADATIRMWSARAEPEVARLEGTWQAFSADGEQLLTINREQTALLWKSLETTPIRVPGRVAARSIYVSADRRRLATTHGDALQLWSLQNGRPIAELKHEPPIDWEQVRHREEVERGRSYREVRPKIDELKAKGSVALAALSPNGSHVITTRADEIARLWEVLSGRVLARIPYREMLTARFSRDGTRLVTLISGDGIRLWDTATGNSIGKIAPGNGIKVLELASNARRVLTHGNNGAMLWDVAGSGLLAHVPQANRVLVSPDTRYFLTQEPGKVRLWDFNTALELTSVTCECGIEQMVFSPLSNLFAVTADDGIVRLRNVNKGGKELDLEPKSELDNIVIGPENRWLVATGVLMAWAEYETDIGRPKGTGVSSWFAQVWNLDTNQIAFAVQLDFPAQSVIFSSDGEHIALGSLVVELASGRRLDQVEETVVAFTPDSRYLVSQSGGYTKVWPWRTADLLSTACKRLAGNGLDPEAWRRFLGDEPYRNSCDGG